MGKLILNDYSLVINQGCLPYIRGRFGKGKKGVASRHSLVLAYTPTQALKLTNFTLTCAFSNNYVAVRVHLLPNQFYTAEQGHAESKGTSLVSTTPHPVSATVHILPLMMVFEINIIFLLLLSTLMTTLNSAPLPLGHPLATS